MPVPKTDALPLGYTPYGLVLDGRTGRGGREKQGSKNEPSRARTRDIASKQQDSLLFVDRLQQARDSNRNKR